MGIDEGRLDAESGQGVLQQVGGAAVDGFLGDDVAAVLGQSLDGVVDGSCAGGHCQRGDTALERGNALLKDILGGVGQAAIDVAGILEAKTVCGVLGVMENIGSGLVDGHRTGIGDGIGLLLADVQLKGLKMQFTLAHDKILISVFCKRKAGGRFGTTPGQNMQCGADFTGSAKHCPAPGLHLPGS